MFGIDFTFSDFTDLAVSSNCLMGFFIIIRMV